MALSRLVRLAGLVTMAGSAAFALVLLLSPWLAQVAHNAFGLFGFMEAVLIPMSFVLLMVAAIVAIVATALLLRSTPRARLGSLAGAVSLIGAVLILAGLFMGFVGALVIAVGVLVAIGGLVIMANLAVRTETLPWWGGVALVVGFVPFLLMPPFFYFPPQAHPLIGVPWLVAGYAIFRAAGGRTERPARVR